MMNYEYRDTIDYWNARGTAIRIYMDDIAIATSTNLDDHIKAVSAVFEVAERLGPILQTGEMHLPCPAYGLPGGNP
jgi:hypothetical protein